MDHKLGLVGGDIFGRDALANAREDLDGRRTHAPVQFQRADTQVQGVVKRGRRIFLQRMRSGGLADDVLVRLINYGNERPLTLQLERPELRKRSEGGIFGPLSSGRNSTLDPSTHGLDGSAPKIPVGRESAIRYGRAQMIVLL